MTPEEIQAQYATITWKDVCEVSSLLSRFLPESKHDRLYRIVHEGKQENLAPSIAMRSTLASAYDWFAYGN